MMHRKLVIAALMTCVLATIVVTQTGCTSDKPSTLSEKTIAPHASVNAVCPVTKKVLTNSAVVREWNGKRVALLNARAAVRWDKFSDAKKTSRLAVVMKMKSK